MMPSSVCVPPVLSASVLFLTLKFVGAANVPCGFNPSGIVNETVEELLVSIRVPLYFQAVTLKLSFTFSASPGKETIALRLFALASCEVTTAPVTLIRKPSSSTD